MKKIYLDRNYEHTGSATITLIAGSEVIAQVLKYVNTLREDHNLWVTIGSEVREIAPS